MFPIKDTARARHVPVVTWLIIAANVAVFLLETSLSPVQLDRLIRLYGVTPRRFLQDWETGQFLTLFTSLFLHGGWFHLISNMWALYLFGDNVEDRMGHGRFLLFYGLCGALAALTQVFASPASRLPMVGASGAIAGVLGAYFVLFPRARVITFVPLYFLPYLVEIPALFYLAFWFVSQLFNGLFALAVASEIAGGVAWWAHVGGFASGVILVKFFEQRRAYRPWYPDEYWPW
jgi:membrane associated rhomboid family serine protease